MNTSSANKYQCEFCAGIVRSQKVFSQMMGMPEYKDDKYNDVHLVHTKCAAKVADCVTPIATRGEISLVRVIMPSKLSTVDDFLKRATKRVRSPKSAYARAGKITKFFISCQSGTKYNVIVHRGYIARTDETRAKRQRQYVVSSNSVTIQWLSNLANSYGKHQDKITDVTMQLTVYPTICIYLKGYYHD